MKALFNKIVLLMFFGFVSIIAQDITFVPQDTLLVDTLNADMAFYIDVTNTSTQDQTIYLVRTQNDLPANWQSSLCFDFCWAPQVDSIATTPDFMSTPLTPGEHREISVHIFPQNNPGTAHVRIKAGTFRSPGVTFTVNLTAIAQPVGVKDKTPIADDFLLSQNYPNPFNPVTKIRYTIPALTSFLSQGERMSEGQVRVILKVYDVLGNEVAILVNEEKEPGAYEVEFNSVSSIQHPASGIYFYRLWVGNFIQTRKMILEK